MMQDNVPQTTMVTQIYVIHAEVEKLAQEVTALAHTCIMTCYECA